MAKRFKSTKAKPRKGRPSKFDAARGVIVRALKNGVPIRTACGVAGVSKTTFYSWMNQGEGDPESEFGKFADEVKRARCRGEQRLVDIIRRAAERGEWKASAWLLERVFYEQYGRRIAVESPGQPAKDNPPPPQIVITERSADYVPPGSQTPQ